MGLHADKILATARLAQTGQSIDYLFKHCCQFPDNSFDPVDLLSGDRVFILYVLRGITYGNIYEFSLQCPQCECTSMHRYDLNRLAETITGPDELLGQEPFKVILPHLSKTFGKEIWLRLRFMRGRDISSIANKAKFKKRSQVQPTTKQRPGAKQVTIDESITENLNLVISDFMGIPDKARIAAVLEKLQSTDTATIREFLREKAPGIDTSIAVQCPECSAEFNTELPMTESFFRPTKL
jgi:hypothetical protein